MKTIKYLILGFIGLLSFTACKKMDSTYKEYVVPSGIIYPGKVLDAEVKSGLNEAKLTWKRGSDPKVTKARVYWNYYTDSMDVVMPVDQAQVSCLIKNLEENFYTFVIKTYDEEGHVSVPVEVSGTIHGERYQASLLNRTAKARVNVDNTIYILFDQVNSSSDIVKSEVTYTTKSNQEKTVSVNADENSVILSDYKLGTSYNMRTVYLPATAYKTMVSDEESFEVNKLNKQQWKIVGYSSYYNTDTPAKMIDGNPATRWGTLSPHTYPHFFTVDFGVPRILTSASLWRQTPTNEEGPDEVQFLGSNDNVNFVVLGNYPFNRLSNAEQVYTLTATNAFRYFQVKQIRGPKNYVVMGEFDVTAKF